MLFVMSVKGYYFVIINEFYRRIEDDSKRDFPKGA